jgi:uncharacterized protein
LIAVDTNLLVHAHRKDMAFHAAGKVCLERLCAGPRPWAIPWPCVHEFLAVATNRRIFRAPSTPDQAVQQVEAWMGSPSLVLLGEGPVHWPNLTKLLRAGAVTGGLVHDARIAAICVGHGVRELWTLDRDFSRFPSLATRNPLVGA